MLSSDNYQYVYIVIVVTTDMNAILSEGNHGFLRNNFEGPEKRNNNYYFWSEPTYLLTHHR